MAKEIQVHQEYLFAFSQEEVNLLAAHLYYMSSDTTMTKEATALTNKLERFFHERMNLKTKVWAD